jgi:prepilin-type N-terminal cleavage/methylation domain-containing protein
MKDRKGFTLVELLLVVAILAFLIAIIVIASSEIGKDSRKKAMFASLRNLDAALNTYNVNWSNFPPASGWNTALLYWDANRPRLIDAIPKDSYRGTGTNDVTYELDISVKPTYLCLSYGPNDAKDYSVGNDTLTGTYVDDIYVTNAKGFKFGQ